MRQGVIKEVYELMKENKNVYFLTGDLGYSVIERIEKDFPERFINVGVAEQNLMGIAAGLALSGKKVFVYSIIPFVTMRCYEQIRDDICYHDLDVTILGVGAGLSYGILGGTHFALEDIAILRPLPNMTIFSPADEIEAILGVRYFKNYHHPVYFRIGKKEEPKIYKTPYYFNFGKGVILKKGDDIAIFSTGPIISEVVKTVDLLREKNISASLINIHTIKPIDYELIINESRNKKFIFVVEEHSVLGGLGSSIVEILSENIRNNSIKVIRIGTKDKFIKRIGTQSYLRKFLKLDSQEIFKKILFYLYEK